MCVSIIILTLLSAYITVFHPQLAVEWLEFDPIPYIEDRIFLLLLAILSGVCSYLFETYVIDHILLGVRERQVFDYNNRPHINKATFTDSKSVNNLLTVRGMPLSMNGFSTRLEESLTGSVYKQWLAFALNPTLLFPQMENQVRMLQAANVGPNL